MHVKLQRNGTQRDESVTNIIPIEIIYSIKLKDKN